LVVKTFVTAVSTFVTVTVTPGIRAPELSVTVPRMSPAFVLWPKHAPLPTIRNRGRTHRFNFIMELPPELLTVSTPQPQKSHQNIHRTQMENRFFKQFATKINVRAD
jgi:hypothetical protein